MESDRPHEESSSAEHSAEQEPDAIIEALPAKLGFVETTELIVLRQMMQDARASGDFDAAWVAYRAYGELAEAVVDQLTGDEYARAQIGMIIATARMRKDDAVVERYLWNLQDAMTSALNMGYDDIVEELRPAIDAIAMQIGSDE